MVLHSESKSIAISEVSSRNEILNESLEKMKNELFKLKKIMSSLEAEKFDIDKENMRLNKELKKHEN